MPSPVSWRLLRRGLIAGAVVLVALGAAITFVLAHAPGDVSHPNVEFTRPTVSQPPPTSSSTSSSTSPAPKPRHRVPDTFQWPWYGFDAGRTRVFAGTPKLHPPLRVGWRFDDGGLLEFPPSIYQTTLYLLDDNGWARGIDTRTGRVRWARQVGTLAAASPAVAANAGLVLMPLLSTHGRRPGGGRFVALSMRNGHTVWAHPLPAGSESSPIVHGSTVYFGDQGGMLWALNVTTGHVDWTYHASGPIKGGPAFANGILYFGDYAGRAYAVQAANGHQVWSVGTDGAHFGFGSGQFYSSPAVAFGRVYMGNTDGRMYSFGARDGTLAWATTTGAYIYASPAVADTPGLGPTVYAGSYDGRFYAFNAQSGAIRWSHPAGGKISGSATVVDGVVYYSDLASKTTAGLNAQTGAQVFSFSDGAFNPVIADFGAIYLDGYQTVYQMLPVTHPPPHRRVRRANPRHQPRKRRARKAPAHHGRPAKPHAVKKRARGR
jgi:outer membrane protein assembly factor BamB